jgi:uncharacterized protein
LLLLATVLVGLAIVVGICGIVVPVLPGSSLILAAVVIWSLVAQDPVGWWVLGISAVAAIIGWVLQYLIPGRRMRAVGVPNLTLIVGAVVGVVGMVVIPVAGLPIGFVVGVLAAELVRLRALDKAWPSTVHALRAALLSYGIELGAAMTMAVTWGVGVSRVLY